MTIKFNGVRIIGCSSSGGGAGNTTTNLLADSKWKMSTASNPGDVNPANGYFKYFEVENSLQVALNSVNSSAKSVVEYLTSARALSQTEDLAITIVQADDQNTYRSGLVTAVSSIYSTGPGSAAIIATTLLDSSGSLTPDKEYSILVNLKGEQGFQGIQGPQGVQGIQGYQGYQGVQGHIGVPTAPQGEQGVQGVPGERGDRGDPGPQGMQGSQGPQGLFGGPQGFQGVQGPQGVQGDPQGPQGVQGAPGPEGAWGPQGPQGYPGDRGPQGYQGVAGGPQGYQGIQGATGPQGYQGFFGGPQGDRGYQRVPGTQGYQGVQGATGAQGYQGNQGFQGTPGFVGTQGPDGPQGSQGPQGTQGYQGYQGDSIQGTQGSQGPQGAQGNQGFQGAQGTQGIQGDPTGPQGPQGYQGSSGNAGVSSTYIEAPAADPLVTLLLHMNGTNNSVTFTDKSYSTKSITAFGDAKIVTTTSKFGGASASFDGTGDYLFVPYSSDFDFSAGDFTIEGWVNLNSLATQVALIGKHHQSFASNIVFFITNSTTVTLYGPGSVSTARTVPTISTGVWYHWAIVRSGSSTLIFWNGTQAGASISGSFTNSTSVGLTIGGHRENSIQETLNGYLDEVRISRVARYTSNFTPSTTAFPNADSTLEASLLPSTPSVGDIVYSNKGFYVCSSASPVSWKEYSLTPSTVTA